jgi:hypothetical protein
VKILGSALVAAVAVPQQPTDDSADAWTCQWPQHML